MVTFVTLEKSQKLEVWYALCASISMKFLLLTSFLFMTSAFADVLLVEDDVINFSVPEDLLKKPSNKDNVLVYRDSEKKLKLIVQTFRKNQWSDWHMKGLKKYKKTFQKFFDTELGGSEGEILHEVSYDDQSHVLSLTWSQPNGVHLLSKMKLTSFGCVAFHAPYTKGNKELAEIILLDVLASVKIPKNLEFVPKSVINDLMSNIGGGFFFLVISLVYLMFSLFKRSQLRQMKLERRMQHIRESHLQTRAN